MPAVDAGPILKQYIEIATATRPYFRAEPSAPINEFVAEARLDPVLELVERQLPAGAAPVPDGHDETRGVVAEGRVGSKWLGRLRIFRYEIHRWRDGVIPDADQAAATTTLQLPPADAQRLLDLVPAVPTPVWGRDELDAGEIWNSNSVTSWILRRAGIDTTDLTPPDGGRAPGWNAGLAVAAADMP